MPEFEVELKFPLPQGRGALLAMLQSRGAKLRDAVRQVDIYFAHPQRDFATTDEALRLRSVGEENYLTYKGPILDTQSKTRQEIEISFASGTRVANQMWALLRAVGFRDVRKVTKDRSELEMDWEGRTFHVSLDSVEGLGEYLEIETISSGDDWHEARDAALRLAQSLGLDESERRSYLQLLLESDAKQDA